MRLRKIKLAGFKSFVDPTTLTIPGNLVAVVGPNGCGKSNIIDAVLWVMGESSAKHLRGDSLTDVIFNGSSARNPVGQATVELLFDNSEGRAGGQYASYSEIAIKRQINRDSVSTYYLNGTRCRRRDIQEIFLGTGLGPRSYAIIEQGTISRLIEAKPEDRLFSTFSSSSCRCFSTVARCNLSSLISCSLVSVHFCSSMPLQILDHPRPSHIPSRVITDSFPSNCVLICFAVSRSSAT